MKYATLLLFSLLSATASSKVKYDVNVEQFYAELKKANVKNVKSAVALLDNEFFKFENYAVLFQSMSIQPSSFDYPRILMFGKNKKMRIGINHLLGEKRNIEVLQYRDSKKVWELREIEFSKNSISLSEVNPSICMSCHGDKEILPSFKGRFEQINKYNTDFVLSGKKPDISNFKRLITKDPVYSRLKDLNKYLQDLGL